MKSNVSSFISKIINVPKKRKKSGNKFPIPRIFFQKILFLILTSSCMHVAVRVFCS